MDGVYMDVHLACHFRTKSRIEGNDVEEEPVWAIGKHYIYEEKAFGARRSS